MKILIVSTYFPPQNSIASLRPYSWAKWWSRMGHDVTVLTTEKQVSESDLSLETTSFKVIELPLKIPFASASKAVKTAAKEGVQKKSVKIRLLTFLKKRFIEFATKTGCFLTCRYPDWHDGWAKKAQKFLKSKSTTSWDLVISSGGPYSVHRVGYFLKKNNHTKRWVVDWRDLWTQNHLYPGLKLFHLYERSLEKRFHSKADQIITVSDGLAESLRKITKTAVSVIYNGFDPEDFSNLFKNSRKKSEVLNLAYLGSIYKGFQDPAPLLKAIKNLAQDGKITPSDIQIRFAGANSDIAEQIVEFGLADYYSYLGFLPREQALQEEYDADAVIFLEYENPRVKGVLTGKLFEYIYISREIWAVGTSNKTAAGELIEKTGSGLCFGHDVRKIEDYILESLEKKKRGTLDEQEKVGAVIDGFTRERQAEKLLEISMQGIKRG